VRRGLVAITVVVSAVVVFTLVVARPWGDHHRLAVVAGRPSPTAREAGSSTIAPTTTAPTMTAPTMTAPTTTAPTTTAPTTTAPTTTIVSPTTGAPAPNGIGSGPSTKAIIDPGSLPQTGDKPSGSDAGFQSRMRLLVQAVASGDASAALPAFFPLRAYDQVKAVRDPAADWQGRLISLYDADIANLHASLGSAARSMQFLGADVPDAAAGWVGPGAEVNRIGYWRVYDTRVRYSVSGGTASFTVISLISWRGQWYVVHFRTPPR